MANIVDEKTLISILEANGWELGRTRGSHMQMVKENAPTLTIAAQCKGGIPMGTARSIVRAAGEEVENAFKKIVQQGGGKKALKRYVKARKHSFQP